MLREQHAVIARAQFVEVDAIASLYLVRCAEDERRGCNEAFQGEFANAEVGFVYRWTEATAQRVIGLGIDLRWRLRGTSAAFAAGEINQARAQTISDVLANVSPDKVELIERLLLDGTKDLNTSKLRQKARWLIARHDPEGAKQRRERAEADCDIRFHANEDGTCAIEGTLPGPGGQTVAMRLRKMCFEVCGNDPRTFAQRRADALVALAAGTGFLACRCGRGDCTAPGASQAVATRTAVPVAEPVERTADAGDEAETAEFASTKATLSPLPTATIHVGVNLTTLLGLDDLPGHLAGHGWIDADLAREIAADGTWRKVLTLTESDREAVLDALCGHPHTGAPPPNQVSAQNCIDTADTSGKAAPEHDSDGVWLSGRRINTLPHGTIIGIGRALKAAGITPTAIRERTRHRREQLTYRPSARLAEIVRARDGVCRFPGCTARAIICDLDHTIPFDHAHPERGGLTVEQNLACLCRRHHRLKTQGLWTVRQLGAGRLEWTTPTGELVVTEPAGAFNETGRAADEALAATYGLTLTDPLTLARMFHPHNKRGVEADLRYLIDVRTPPIAVIDASTPITVLDGNGPSWPPDIGDHGIQAEPAPF
ncbi:DUF222 domain-containing protein [Rhodococcus sp. NPDC003322]